MEQNFLCALLLSWLPDSFLLNLTFERSEIARSFFVKNQNTGADIGSFAIFSLFPLTRSIRRVRSVLSIYPRTSRTTTSFCFPFGALPVGEQTAYARENEVFRFIDTLDLLRGLLPPTKV
jgi:hypothetical protein